MSPGAATAPEIGPLDAAEVPSATEALARAFRDNPLNRAAIGSPDAERRLRSNRAGTHVLLEVAQARGVVWAARESGRLVGALVGTAPGGYPLPPPPLSRRLVTLWRQGFGATRRWADVFVALDSMHPLEPHWYLGTLGVDPDAQGRGVGTALLRGWLGHASGSPVYLETDRERNVAFYEREGFSVRSRTRVLKVPVWCMQRPAAGEGGG